VSQFERIAGEVGRLVTEKNEAYGSAFATAGDALRLLYPTGIPPEKLRDALLLARIWDKMMRIATRKDYAGESPYRDISGYGVLGAATDEAAAEAQRQADPRAVAWQRFAGLSPVVARELLKAGTIQLPTPAMPDPRKLTAVERLVLMLIDGREERPPLEVAGG
jgi:hypothetical protein